MSLFEITSLTDSSENYKLFDDDPFLLEPEVSCLVDDYSDDTDSLTDSLSPVSHSATRCNQQKLHLQQQHPNVRHRVKEEPPEFPVLDPDVLTHADSYLEVHNYCMGTTVSSCSGRSTASSPGFQETAAGEAGHCSSGSSSDVSPSHVLHEMLDQIDCDEDGEDDDDDEDDEDLIRKCSNSSSNRSKSTSSTSSPTSSLGQRRKSQMDRSLSEEEKRLLVKEGYKDFPENGVLSKGEEKILRKIRRKIRNKKSAQCSRQRKKEYVEELEKKYTKCTNENLALKKEVMKLRRENTSLATKIKNMLADDSMSSTSDQASYKTSFFVLCLSFILIILPFMAPDAVEDVMLMSGKSEDGVMPGRHLLFASNFSPHDLYSSSNDQTHFVASAINSTADQLFSLSSY